MIKSPLERLNWLTSMAADRTIKESAHKVALYLASCCNSDTGQCNPMQDVIELHTGLCEKSVKNGIAQLKNGSYLEAKREGKLNHYTLLIPGSTGGCGQDSDPSQGQAVTPEKPKQGQAVTPEKPKQGQAVTPEIIVRGKLVPTQGQAGSKIGVTGCPPVEQGKEQGKNKKEAQAQLRMRFERFYYDAYPIHKDRARAQKAFEKINPDNNLLEKMLTAIAEQKAEREWKTEAGKFVPNWKNAATWLNGHCWEDEIERPQSAGSGNFPNRTEDEWQDVAREHGITHWRPGMDWLVWRNQVHQAELATRKGAA